MDNPASFHTSSKSAFLLLSSLFPISIIDCALAVVECRARPWTTFCMFLIVSSPVWHFNIDRDLVPDCHRPYQGGATATRVLPLWQVLPDYPVELAHLLVSLCVVDDPPVAGVSRARGCEHMGTCSQVTCVERVTPTVFLSSVAYTVWVHSSICQTIDKSQKAHLLKRIHLLFYTRKEYFKRMLRLRFSILFSNIQKNLWSKMAEAQLENHIFYV